MVATDVASRGIGMYRHPPFSPPPSPRSHPVPASTATSSSCACCTLLLCLGALLIARTCLTSCLSGLFEWRWRFGSVTQQAWLPAAFVILRSYLFSYRGTSVELGRCLDPAQTVSQDFQGPRTRRPTPTGVTLSATDSPSARRKVLKVTRQHH